MANNGTSLIAAIEAQLLHLQDAILTTDENSDERLALSTLNEELHLWLDRTKQEIENGTNDLKPEHAPSSKYSVKRQCGFCLESFPRSETYVIRHCKCRYCHNCLAYMFESHLEAQNIVRCCNRNVTAPKILASKNRKMCREYAELYKQLDADNPMYCASSTCSAFLGNFRRLKRAITCPQCKTKSCTSCRLAMSEHKGVNQLCPEDVNDSMMQKAVDQYKMNRCPNCYVVIEKNGGCNNVRCKCGVLFCYQCGECKKVEAAYCRCIRRARDAMPNAADFPLVLQRD